MNQPKTALILGATGGVGGETARALLRHGWTVRALARRIPQNPGNAMHWIEGDAMVANDVLSAARGVDVIVHAVNPPGYRNWGRLVLPMIDNTIAAARATGARIVLPGTVYNYGPDAFPVLSEDSPQRPQTTKGAIRVELEQRLAAAARDSVATLVLRCGDFFGPHAGNNWMAQGLVKPGKALRAVTYPGPREAGHAWAYLPDVGETVARLLERGDALDTFAVFHFDGHYVSGDELVSAIRRVAQQPALPVRRFPWALLALAAPFMETLRELRPMRYLWQSPIRLNGARLHAFLGQVPHTPIDTALKTTLLAMGVLRDRA
ncbi:nucleoside-diphosphate-sugar epimerase [Luteibacter sp. Sphag1AF]|uniref:NAD-dependent epimerase/dehydratase family protein n=1 Tax=Luteibacter sp. Sphag1AF TaxID=2587031 RepID=UPI001607C502|nr:NAD-dependent epimerase/dehydratase family protein [Luteibacter sp. Sphag1AF]MBB3229119.1 nucleoside-diphosphate-sugar epimerase [Luteibacter sp. Sphag1AF]